MNNRKSRSDQRFSLRRAVPGDSRFLYELRCDPVVRMASFNTSRIPWDEHVNWYEHALEDKSQHIFILEDTGTGRPCGQLRLCREEMTGQQGADRQSAEGVCSPGGHAFVISYSVSEEYRGRGLGRLLLEVAEQEAAKINASDDVVTMIGEVKEHNTASRHLFESLGYTCTQSEPGVFRYIKNLM